MPAPNVTKSLAALVAAHASRIRDLFAGKTRREGECLVWTGGMNAGGYGVLKINKVGFLAHRVSWVATNGVEIPDGNCICHSCDNRACVEPSHLRPGTIRDNMIDMYAKGRGASTRRRGGRVIAADITPHFIAYAHRDSE
jgi:hypothetical protein